MTEQSYKIFGVTCLLVLLPTVMRAQGTGVGVGAPIPASGDRRSLTLLSGQDESNMLTFGLGLGSSYNDNAFTREESQVERKDLSYRIYPSITVRQARPRVGLLFRYGPGVSIHQRDSLFDRRTTTHRASAEIAYQVTRRFTVRVRERFSITTHPFDSSDENFGVEFGDLDRPNETVLLPNSRRTRNLGSLDLFYQLGSRDIVGARGVYSDVRYQRLSAIGPGSPGSLIGTRRARGTAFYVRQVSGAHAIGTIYDFRDRRSSRQSTSRVSAHRLLYFHSIQFTPNSSLSIFAGPEYSRRRDQVVLNVDSIPNSIVEINFPGLNDRWEVSGGASYGWQGQRTSFRVGFVRGNRGGGGLRGSVRLHRVTAQIRRQLTRRWRADFRGRYGDNSTVDLPPTITDTLRLLRGTVGLTYKLTKSVSWQMRYSRSEQERRGSLFPERSTERNRFAASLNFNFRRPLGR